jgi:rfaE bifunctional protein nucleotidyltransferase chain/domain
MIQAIEQTSSNKKPIKNYSVRSTKKTAKIKSLVKLTAIFRNAQLNGLKIIHAHGVFDLLHVGHIQHLEQAKELGDVLVVTITPDRFVNKGPHRPAFTEKLRAYALAALESVDYVAVTESSTSVEAIEHLKPDIFAKGIEFKGLKDMTGAVSLEAEAVKAVGGKIKFVGNITSSSSSLMNQHLAQFTKPQERFLEGLRQKYSLDEILEWMEKIADFTPLVVGEAVIEEYLFCQGLGQSVKDPVLAVQEESTELYAGGTLSVSNALAEFCKEVVLVTQLGDSKRREGTAKKLLNSKIRPIFLTKSKSPTIYKRQIVDSYTGNKLFEIYNMNIENCSPENTKRLNLEVSKQLNRKPELVVVSDHGHGMVNSLSAGLLSFNSPFIALSTQCNSGNNGCNSINKYKRADYLCISSNELNHEIKENGLSEHERLAKLSLLIDCPNITVTCGKQGTLHYQSPSTMLQVPAFAHRVLDRVGAGDIAFAISSLLVRANAPWDIIGLYSNAAASIHISELGNKDSVDRIKLGRFITSLIK